MKAWHVDWFAFPEGLVPFGLPRPKEFLLGELDENPFPFLWIHVFSPVCVSFHTFLLERAGLSAFIVRNLRYVCFALGLALGNSSARDGLSHTFSPSFSVWCSSEIHPFEQYLERAATAIASAALTVAANDRRIRRQTASSSR